MTDLATFLLARVAEDEAIASDGCAYRGYHSVDCGTLQGYWAESRCICDGPKRVLAECEAKRRIIRAHEKWCDGSCREGRSDADVHGAYWWTMHALAAVYADHPDYREEWRV